MHTTLRSHRCRSRSTRATTRWSRRSRSSGLPSTRGGNWRTPMATRPRDRVVDTGADVRGPDAEGAGRRPPRTTQWPLQQRSLRSPRRAGHGPRHERRRPRSRQQQGLAARRLRPRRRQDPSLQHRTSPPPRLSGTLWRRRHQQVSLLHDPALTFGPTPLPLAKLTSCARGARAQGMQVKAAGRMPAAVISAYNEAHD